MGAHDPSSISEEVREILDLFVEEIQVNYIQAQLQAYLAAIGGVS